MGKTGDARSRALERCGARIKRDAEAFGAFGSGGRVKEAVYPSDGASFVEAAAILSGEDYVVLGGATDVLFPDDSYDGTILSTDKMRDVSRSGDRIYCSAGARLPQVVAKCRKYALSGLEQLSGIPGSVGGAVTMNAGAFGREMAELIVRVDAVTSDGRAVAFGADALGAGYRHTSIAERGLTVLGAELKLCPSTRKEIESCIAGFEERRRASQPQGRSLGSVFKRVNGVSAGYYIDRAGLKGTKSGGAEISRKHANFIVNNGGATGADFIALSELARKTVLEKFGIGLEYEVIFL